MGFPDMKYLDPEVQGKPIDDKTYYKQFREDQNNDVKI